MLFLAIIFWMMIIGPYHTFALIGAIWCLGKVFKFIGQLHEEELKRNITP